MMTQKKMQQYRNLAGEIAEIEERLKRARRRVTVVSDTVRGSSEAFPYCAHTVTVRGVAARRVRAIERIERLRRVRLARSKELLAEIEAFLDSIEDARMRRILSMRYIDGMAWKQIARRIHGSPAYESAVRMAASRFFEICEKN